MEIPCAKTNGAETSCSLNIEQMFGVPLMNPFLPAKKRHTKGMNTFSETEVRQRGKGFDLDAYFKRKEQTKVGKKARKGPKVSSDLGDVRIKYDILSSQTSHQGFSRR